MQLQVSPETNQYNTFSVLGNEMLRINNLGVAPLWGIHIGHFIAELIQCSADNLEGFSLVMTFQVLDIFQQENGGTLGCKNSGNIKEQGSLGITFKAMLSAQGIFLGYTGK